MMTDFTRKNLSEAQVEMLEMCHEMTIMADHLDPYLYVETGAYKPWRPGTHKSLVRKGLVTAEERCHQVYYVRLTAQGAEVAKRLYVEKYGNA